MSKLPRPEYPRPQFTRTDWLNLNGAWQFDIDTGDSGLERGLVEANSKTRSSPILPGVDLIWHRSHGFYERRLVPAQR